MFRQCDRSSTHGRRGWGTLIAAGHWHSGYLFQWLDSGPIFVWRIHSGIFMPFLGWQPRAAIRNDAEWNVLRVVAVGAQLEFYINGTMVWSGTDANLTRGVVGILMSRLPFALKEMIQDVKEERQKIDQ